MAGVKRPLAAMLATDMPDRFSSPDLAIPSVPSRSANSSADSRDSVSRVSTPHLPLLKSAMPKFTADASIIMLGFRATGKTTLAIMAASALKKKIIDLDSAFHRATDLSIPAYSKIHGTSECQKKQGDILQDVLVNNANGSIIICSWMERRVQSLLRQFAATNPVIHVLRNQEAIRDHLRVGSGAKWTTFWDTSIAFFRTCSNLEFFNVSESVAAEAKATANHDSVVTQLPPYLALKRAEKHLLRFLSQIYPLGTIPFSESAYPLAGIPTEKREYTYALVITVDEIIHKRLDIEASSSGADALQITIQDTEVTWRGATSLEEFTRAANRITEAVGILRRSSVLPIIVHIEPPVSPSTSTNMLYLDLLSHALSLAPEMLTVTLQIDDTAISELVSLKGSAKLIGFQHQSGTLQPWSSSERIAQYQRAVELGCDLFRFIRPASSIEDNFEVARFRFSANSLPGPHIPIISYCSGLLGKHSATFNPILTMVSPAENSSEYSNQHTSGLTAQAATEALYAGFLYDRMKLYVFGANVGYSLSPAMHNAALEVCGIPHRYEPYSTTSLGQVKDLIQDHNFGGASVGLPFKVEFITLTDSLSPHAQAIGAINTLIPVRRLDDEGRVPKGTAFFRGINRAGPVLALYGENTDWIGIRACIRRGLSPANAVRPSTSALVVGAGGMARAAVYALLQVGVSNIAIYNRTVSNGKKLADHFRRLLEKTEFEGLGAGRNTKFEVFTSLHESWQSEFRAPTIIISCIPTHPIGDVPSPEFKVPESWLANQTGGVILELGYKTLNTPLLQQAMDHSRGGWIAMDGLDLLPDQGFAQFELFTGRKAPRRTMRKVIFENYPDQYGRSNPEELRRRLQNTID